MLKRSRYVYLVLIVVTLVLGLLSRTSIIPVLIYPYLGDLLYALLIFWLLGFLFPTWSSRRVALTAIVGCWLIELLQLYQADWMQQLRSYRLGGLVLGHGFLWSDLVSYVIGATIGWGLERFFLFRRNDLKTTSKS